METTTTDRSTFVYAGAAPSLRSLRTRKFQLFPLPTGMKVLIGGAGAYYALLALGAQLFN